MDAKLRKIQVVPAKFGKDGEIVKEEFATLTFEVPLDTQDHLDAIVDLFKMQLNREWCAIEVDTHQKTLDGLPSALPKV